MPALCRNASAYDSLPRGARGPNAAIHRLRASGSDATTIGGLPRISTSSSEFGKGGYTDKSALFPNSDSPGRSDASGVPASTRRRTRSAAGVTAGGSSMLKARKKFSRSTVSKGNVELPLASSGSQDGADAAGSEGEWASDAELEAGVRSAPTSPSKPGRPYTPSSPSKLGRVGAPTSLATLASPRPSAPAGPARKRVVDKRSIGLPSNFQHTGHIGAASYGAAVSQASAADLKAQLSGIAAELAFELGPLDGSASVAAPTPAAVQPQLETLAEDDSDAAASTVAASVASPEMEPIVEADLLEEPDEAPLALPPQAGAEVESIASGADARPASPSSVISEEAPSIRPIAPAAGETSPSAATSDFAPSPLASKALPASLPGSSPATPGSSGPVRHKTTASTMGPSSHATSRNANSPYASPSISRATSASSASPSAAATGGFGRAKRKPVPRGLAGILAEPGAPALPPKDDDDVPLSAGASDLARNTSVLGELPSPVRLTGAGGNGGKGSWAARGAAGGSVRMAPLERAKLAAAKLEQAQRAVAEGAGSPPTDEPASVVPKEEEAQLTPAQQAASMRLNGKRFVQGPSGAYITDTANGRWNNALAEITKALADAGTDDKDGKLMSAQDEETAMREAMERADQVLGRLGAES